MKKNRHTQAIKKGIGRLAEDARELFAVTADSAEETLGEARKNFATVLKNGKGMAGEARAKAMDGAKAAVEAVRQHPYQNVGIALALGTLVGFILARRWSHKET